MLTIAAFSVLRLFPHPDLTTSARASPILCLCNFGPKNFKAINCKFVIAGGDEAIGSVAAEGSSSGYSFYQLDYCDICLFTFNFHFAGASTAPETVETGKMNFVLKLSN